ITGLCGALVLLVIWIVRLAMWDIARAVVWLGLGLLVIRQLMKRRLLIGNLIAGAMLMGALWIIPQGNQLLQFTEKREPDVSSGRVLIGEQVVELTLWDRIAARREGFIKRRDDEDDNAGSELDSDVGCHNRSEVVRHPPRATATGLFPPF